VANDKHLTLLRQGTVIWNRWRRRNPKIRPDLGGADLREANLREANLFGADLPRADLSRANLREANLSGALKLPRFRGVLASLVDYASVGWTSIACS
jgi:Pentapeptide repeats (8 copies)